MNVAIFYIEYVFQYVQYGNNAIPQGSPEVI
jgi:hypothetical protein